jgi:hypothetical protein
MEFKTPGELVPKLDIGFAVSLLGDIFGFNSPVFFPSYAVKDWEVRGYQVNDIIVEDNPDRISVLGTPIFGSFTVGGEAYKTWNPITGALDNVRLGEFEFPVATIVEFRRPKNITKTPMIGGVGTVKEIYGLDDWNISIKGICMADASRKGQKTLKEQMYVLDRLNEVAGSIAIQNGAIFSERRISRLVIENLAYSPVQGKPGIMPFEIQAVSDEDIILTL